MAIIISIGKWNGVYICKGRLCLGWITISIIMRDGDDIIAWAHAWLTTTTRGIKYFNKRDP